MGPDAPLRPGVVLVPSSLYVTGMTAEEARRAGGVLVVAGDHHSVAEIISHCEQLRPGMGLIAIDAGKVAAPPEREDRMPFIIERMPEVKVQKRVDVRPPWMGKKPWWQR